MRVVAIVNGYTGALCLQELVDQGDQVVGVVTNPADPGPDTPPERSVKLTADRNYLPVYQPPMREVNSQRFLAILRDLKPDLIVSMHFPVIFCQELLDIPPLGVVNEHPSRLPAGRGMTPSFWHMLIGDDRNWITLHYLDKGIDTGDVIAQGSIPITPDDTGMTTSRKLSEEGHRLFREYLPLIREGRAPRIPQSEIEGVTPSYYSWKPHYARLRWSRPAEDLALQVRTLTIPRGQKSWTGCAYAYLAGQRINVRRASVAMPDAARDGLAPPGSVLGLVGEGILVQTGDGALIIQDADMHGAEAEGLGGVLKLLTTGLPVRLG